MADISVKNLTRYTVPRFAYSKIAREVLPGWDISLAFINSAQAQMLNLRLRKKSYIPNVLSYALGKQSGEILICPEVAAQQAPLYQLPTTNYYLLLFIHGLLHLEGRRHGTTMERRERELLRQFLPLRTNGSTHRHRHRHRDLPGQDSRRRGDPR